MHLCWYRDRVRVKAPSVPLRTWIQFRGFSEPRQMSVWHLSSVQHLQHSTEALEPPADGIDDCLGRTD